MTPELQRLLNDLEAAKSDHALLIRLQGAKARVQELTKEYEAATAAHEAAETARRDAERTSRFDGITKLAVTDITKEASTGILHRNFRISWTAPTYDYASGRTFPQQQSAEGFPAVPEKVLWMLIERHPELIPAGIKAINPDDLPSAFREYFTAKRRGYLRSKVAA